MKTIPMPNISRRYDGGLVTAVRRSDGIFETTNAIFPIAYEEHDVGPYLEATHDRCRHAHYHPLADCQQVTVNRIEQK